MKETRKQTNKGFCNSTVDMLSTGILITFNISGKWISIDEQILKVFDNRSHGNYSFGSNNSNGSYTLTIRNFTLKDKCSYTLMVPFSVGGRQSIIIQDTITLQLNGRI